MTENPLTISAAIGLVLTPFLTYIFAKWMEREKSRLELRKAILQKKMETAENFLDGYSRYLDAIRMVASAIERQDPSRGAKSRELIVTVIKNYQEEFSRFSDNKIHATRAILYFDLKESFSSHDDLIISLDHNIKYEDFREKFEQTNDPTDLQKADDALISMCQWMRDKADTKQKILEDIQRKMLKELNEI